MSKSEKNAEQYFIQRHYRDPGGDDPIRRWLPHPEVARAICGALLANSVRERDLEDRLQDVYVNVLSAFREGGKPAPRDLRAMKAYCATAAKNFAISLQREAAKRRRDLAEPCEREDYALPEPESVDPHDRAEVTGQIDVLALLFREGCMPPDGVAILEGVAAGRSYAEIARNLKTSKATVTRRMEEMRVVCRERMAKLGMVPNPQPLRLVVSNPSAVVVLRAAA